MKSCLFDYLPVSTVGARGGVSRLWAGFSNHPVQRPLRESPRLHDPSLGVADSTSGTRGAQACNRATTVTEWEEAKDAPQAIVSPPRQLVTQEHSRLTKVFEKSLECRIN
jgi:hypothetical protein